MKRLSETPNIRRFQKASAPELVESFTAGRSFPGNRLDARFQRVLA
jgi:hypothetical protein